MFFLTWIVILTRQMNRESGHNRTNPHPADKQEQTNSHGSFPPRVRLAFTLRRQMSKGLPTHLIGTQAFLPALLSYIRNVAAPVSLPLDHVIFQSILLCLIAGDKHLILRTPEEDVGLVVRLTVWVSSSGCDVHQSSLSWSWKSENCSITASPAASPILDQLLDHEHLWVWPSL